MGACNRSSAPASTRSRATTTRSATTASAAKQQTPRRREPHGVLLRRPNRGEERCSVASSSRGRTDGPLFSGATQLAGTQSNCCVSPGPPLLKNWPCHARPDSS
eukprot:Amastigsp_a1156_270.p7 type:complete len:104 gc:universal Amastigsp_a1156_270:871-1182(+)